LKKCIFLQSFRRCEGMGRATEGRNGLGVGGRDGMVEE
jgi:hypothetical protein